MPNGLNMEVKASEIDLNLNFTFDNDNLFNATELNYYKTFNVNNPEIYSGHYPATYSFENDTIGNFPSGEWINNSDDGSTATIINLEAHDKVLKLYDGSIIDGEGANVRNNLEFDVIEGIIEFWFLISDNTKKFDIIGSGTSIHLFTGSGNLVAYDGIQDVVCSISNNVWYHIKLDFNCTSDIYNIIVNGNIELENYDFEAITDYINYFDFRNNFFSGINEGWYGCIDAVGYSWDDNYTIGDNILPVYEINETEQQVKSWEFDFEAFDDLVDVGDDSVNGWTDIEQGYDMVNAINYYTNDSRQIEIEGSNIYEGEYGIEKEFDVESGLVNVSWDLYLDHLNDAGCNFSTEILSFDDTNVIDICLAVENDLGSVYLYYYNGSDFVKLRVGNLAEYTLYNFNLFIDYSSDTWFLRFYINGVFDSSYFGSLYNTGKDGLGKVRFISDTVDVIYGQKFWVDKIGVSINGSSISSEYAYMYLRGDADYWHVREHNLFSFYASGNLSFYVETSATDYDPESPNLELIKSLIDYAPNDYLINVYDVSHLGQVSFSDMKLFVVLYDTIQFYNVSMDGVILKEGINEYSLEYSHNGVNIDDNYFYVDSNNRLQYILIADDHYNEYIQAIFNINDISAENRSIKFITDINGNAYGFFSVNYYDSTASVIDIPYYYTKTNVILPQTKLVDEFLILITDNDLTNNTVCTGYISNIQLIYNPDLQATITTLTLLAIIVPLMIMIVPPITLHKKFGITGVFVMFLLMSIVCVATGLIPIWLFFIIAFCSIGLLAMKKEVGDKI